MSHVAGLHNCGTDWEKVKIVFTLKFMLQLLNNKQCDSCSFSYFSCPNREKQIISDVMLQ